MTDHVSPANLASSTLSNKDLPNNQHTPAVDYIAYAELIDRKRLEFQELLAKYPEFVTGEAVGRLEYFVGEDLANGKDPRSHLTWHGSSENLVRLFSEYVGLYAFTTEDIRSYLPLLDVKDKRCLTVAASGDHIINLLMAGAREVVAFDSVAGAEDVTLFKIQALIDLDWKDAAHFRGWLWQEVLNPKIFARLLDRQPAGRQERTSILAKAISVFPIGEADSIFKRWQTSGRNAYIVDEHSFKKAREACKTAFEDGRVTFVNADVRELPYLNLGKFDAISLSNILQSRMEKIGPPTSITRDEPPWKMRTASERQFTLSGLVNTMIWPVAEMLNPGGRMMASYCYACNRPDEIGGPEPETDVDTLCEAGRLMLMEARAERLIGNGDLSQTVSRRLAFEPRSGFSVCEHEWELVNGECSGVDIAVMIHRDVA